ncbi:MAG: DUF2807 domain-containing protein [Bacteroidales bacterium]|jgi:hypothetical protein|nr:DUF2807 domain-containing protein [Bacteroidales bacterium]
MRTIRILTSFFFLFLSISISAQQELKFPLGDFKKVVVYDGIDLELIKSEFNEANIQCEGIDVAKISLEISGSVLKIKANRPPFEKGIKIRAVINYTELEEVKANNQSTVIFQSPVYGDNFEITANTGSSISLRSGLKILEVKAQYNSKIQIEGGVQLLRAKCNTGSEINAQHLVCQEALLEAHTGGILHARVEEMLNATAGTGAQIFYTGRPSKETVSSSFGGSVTREN